MSSDKGGYSGFTPHWKRPTIPTKIGARVPLSQRVRRKKRNSPSQEDTSAPSISNLHSQYQLHRARDSVYSSSFGSKPVESVIDLRAPRTTGVLASRDPDTAPSRPTVDSSQTYQSTYRTSFSSSTRPVQREATHVNRRQDWSSTRVRFVSSSPPSSKRTERGPARFSTVASVTDAMDTLDLQSGTTKGTSHVSTYMGHVTSHQGRNRRAGPTDTGSETLASSLRTTDQSQTDQGSNIPGYSGFVPKSLVNRREVPFRIDPRTTKETEHAAKEMDLGEDRVFHGVASLTAREFFQMPDAGSSDGVAAAAKYFACMRPMEGAPKMS